MRTLIATAPGMITHELVTVNEAADDVLTIALLNGETMGGIARWAAKDELLAIADNVAAGTPAPEIARQLVIVLADLEHAGVPEDDSGYAKVAEALRMVEAADASRCSPTGSSTPSGPSPTGPPTRSPATSSAPWPTPCFCSWAPSARTRRQHSGVVSCGEGRVPRRILQPRSAINGNQDRDRKP
jgi:hypothetical protein